MRIVGGRVATMTETRTYERVPRCCWMIWLGVIETLKERITAHGPSLRASETRTRMALIDPLLGALGWDVTDPEMVTPEYSVGNGRADYALLSKDMTPVAFIEAKHLGEPLERPQQEDQLFTYALRQQVKYAALTDGNRWLLDDVSVFSGGERRLLQISIAEHADARICSQAAATVARQPGDWAAGGGERASTSHSRAGCRN